MGASESRLDDDKGLQLCRARKKFIKQALNGRCSLAASHIAYTDELKIIGAALRRFVETNAQVESLRSPSHEQHVFVEISQSPSRQVDATPNFPPSPSAVISSQYRSHHVSFTRKPSVIIEEKPPVNVEVSVSSTPPPSATPLSTEGPEESAFDTSAVHPENLPWDYFGLSHPIDSHFSPQAQNVFDQGMGNSNDTEPIKMEEEAPELLDVEEKLSSHEIEESQASEDEFDEPSSSTLVRSFKNINRSTEKLSDGDSPLENAESIASEIKFSNMESANEMKANLVDGDSSIRSSENVKPETKFDNVNDHKSPDLSPLGAASSMLVHLTNVNITPMDSSEVEEKVVPKDFISSIKDIELIFIKASESGKEVPRMLEANKFHFRPVFPGRESGSVASARSLFKSCFSCGQDPSEVPHEPPQNSVKYLTWHRTTSSRSASSRNLLGAKSVDSVGDLGGDMFENFFMNSGSHASTLDRLYAWEKKLYDEVKASQLLRSSFDQKCKALRHQESRGENTDKMRAVVKDLHTRIRVAIHRIDSISKKIEEIRDMELEPQLEELIEGLRTMWVGMLDCHRLQFHIISLSHSPGRLNTSVPSDLLRQVAIHLETELNSFISIFTKWIDAQKLYVGIIDEWLLKCVWVPRNTSRRNRRMKPPAVRNFGPPIYMICSAWLDLIKELPSKGVIESTRDLAAEVAKFLPRQEKKSGRHPQKPLNEDHGDSGINTLRQGASPEGVHALDRLHTSLAGFLGQLSNFAEFCVLKYANVKQVFQEAKRNYETSKSQQG